MMAVVVRGKPANSLEEYEMSGDCVERLHGDTLGGTSHDARDMQRMGKKQELRVSQLNYTRFSGTERCNSEVFG